MTESYPPMKRGDDVRTWFDAGACGAQILFGRVIKAGPATFAVAWENGNRCRVSQGYTGVVKCGPELDDPAEKACQR